MSAAARITACVGRSHCLPAQLAATSVLGTLCGRVCHSCWPSGTQGAGGGKGPSREELKRRHAGGHGVPGSTSGLVCLGNCPGNQPSPALSGPAWVFPMSAGRGFTPHNSRSSLWSPLPNASPLSPNSQCCPTPAAFSSHTSPTRYLIATLLALSLITKHE